MQQVRSRVQRKPELALPVICRRRADMTPFLVVVASPSSFWLRPNESLGMYLQSCVFGACNLIHQQIIISGCQVSMPRKSARPAIQAYSIGHISPHSHIWASSQGCRQILNAGPHALESYPPVQEPRFFSVGAEAQYQFRIGLHPATQASQPVSACRPAVGIAQDNPFTSSALEPFGQCAFLTKCTT